MAGSAALVPTSAGGRLRQRSSRCQRHPEECRLAPSFQPDAGFRGRLPLAGPVESARSRADPNLEIMNSREVSEDVRAFLRDHVETYEKLEVLLLLADHRETRWSTDSAAARLKLTPVSAQQALEGLVASHILDVRDEEGGRVFQYRPVSPMIEETVHRLLDAQESRRLDIIRLMSANAIARIRNSAIDTFASAFLLRGRNKDG